MLQKMINKGFSPESRNFYINATKDTHPYESSGQEVGVPNVVFEAINRYEGMSMVSVITEKRNYKNGLTFSFTYDMKYLIHSSSGHLYDIKYTHDVRLKRVNTNASVTHIEPMKIKDIAVMFAPLLFIERMDGHSLGAEEMYLYFNNLNLYLNSRNDSEISQCILKEFNLIFSPEGDISFPGFKGDYIFSFSTKEYFEKPFRPSMNVFILNSCLSLNDESISKLNVTMPEIALQAIIAQSELEESGQEELLIISTLDDKYQMHFAFEVKAHEDRFYNAYYIIEEHLNSYVYRAKLIKKGITNDSIFTKKALSIYSDVYRTDTNIGAKN